MTYKGAIKQLYEMRDNIWMPEFFKPYFDKIIETLTADVRENVKGEWQVTENIENDCYIVRCSNCHASVMVGRRILYDAKIELNNYCPNCGADMRPITALSKNAEIDSNLKGGES